MYERKTEMLMYVQLWLSSAFSVLALFYNSKVSNVLLSSIGLCLAFVIWQFNLTLTGF